MRITKIEYHQLNTFGSYQNEVFKAEADVFEGEDLDLAGHELQAYVKKQIDCSNLLREHAEIADRLQREQEWKRRQRNTRARERRRKKREMQKWLADNPGKTEQDYRDYMTEQDPFYDE